MAYWRPHLDAAQVDAKSNPNDLVTIADSEIEALVTGYLRTARPEDRVIGEEGAEATSLAEAPGAEQVASALTVAPGEPAGGRAGRQAIEWHVDPIDGTVNYVRGIEQHCFSIGGRDARTGEWVVGLVAAPALRSVWFARAGAGAWKSSVLPGPAVLNSADGDPGFTSLSGTPRGRRGRVVATGFGYAPERRASQLAALDEIMAEFDDLRRCGSAAIDLCYAAEGRVNAYFERGIEVYDWAGGAFIAEEAGLSVQRPTPDDKLCIAADTPERFDFIRARA